MNPSPLTLWSNKKIRLLLILFVVILIGWFVFKSVSTSQTYTAPEARLMPFSSNNQTQVVGNDIYTFDGVAFSKTDPKTGKRTVLSRPVRYPEVESVWYLGDKGALATFKGSFDSTPAEEYIYKYGLLSASETTIKQNYLWYIDFPTGDITLINSDYADNKYVYYDTASQKAYILFTRNLEGYDESVASQNSSQIAEFDPSTKTIVKQTTASDIVDASGLFSCTAGVFCVVGTLNDGSSTLSVSNKDGSLSQLASDKYTNFLPTNDKNTFLIAKPSSGDQQSASLEDEVSLEGPFSLSLFDTTSKKTTKISTVVDNDSGVLAFREDDNISVLYGSASTSYISVHAKNRLGWFVSKQTKTKLNTMGVGLPSYAEDGSFGIIQSADNSYISLGNVASLSSYDKNYYQSVVSGCIGSDESFLYDEEGQRFMISLIYSSAVQQRVDSLASCIYKDTSKTTGVMFRIALMSPTTGQIISY